MAVIIDLLSIRRKKIIAQYIAFYGTTYEKIAKPTKKAK